MCKNMDRAEKRRQQKLAEKAKKSKARNKPEEGQLQNHQQLAQAFGGVESLTDAQRIFIEKWEVEAFRAKQLS